MRLSHLRITLPQEEFDRLCDIAIEHERDPHQQARWIIRQFIASESESRTAHKEHSHEAVMHAV